LVVAYQYVTSYRRQTAPRGSGTTSEPDVTGSCSSTRSGSLFDSKAARVVGLCRTMEHGIGSGSTGLEHQVRAAEGVMVRRLSVASHDSGAESPVYGAEPTVSIGSGDRALEPRRSGGGATRDITITVDWTLPHAGDDRCVATRANLRHVGDRPANRKMVCKGHPCIYTADGNPMTRFASSWAVPCGSRSPRTLTDVHGREG